MKPGQSLFSLPVATHTAETRPLCPDLSQAYELPTLQSAFPAIGQPKHKLPPNRAPCCPTHFPVICGHKPKPGKPERATLPTLATLHISRQPRHEAKTHLQAPADSLFPCPFPLSRRLRPNPATIPFALSAQTDLSAGLRFNRRYPEKQPVT